MLFVYRQQTQRLLQDAGVAVFNPGDLDFYINSARGQIAGEGESIRVYASLAVTAPTQQYPFSSISLGGASGVAGVLNVRMASFSYLGVAGVTIIVPREWEFFNQYVLGIQVPVAGPPSVWAQFGQGANGTIFINLPDTSYTLNLDAVCYPSTLTADTDPEALPYLWTDCVPYFAAYLALLSAQKADAAMAMFKLYEMFVGRARQIATPSVLPHQYEQTADAQMASRLNLQQGKA